MPATGCGSRSRRGGLPTACAFRRGRWGTFGLSAILLALLVLASARPAAAQEDPNLESTPFLRIDPDRTVITDANGFAPCGECHTAEWEVWRETPHATGFDDLHRTESAQDILDQMGLRVTKRQESLCMRCHYTAGPDRTAIAGVSCESCHGPGSDWIDIHNRWGEGVTHPDDETPEHRQDRIEQSVAGGMLRPSGDIYAVAANCYECHTVPNEDLVNRGGHSTGSSNFDLVERTDEIRHNFVHRQWGEEAGNREQSPERQRMLFVTGSLLDYEFALRGLAEASAEGRYASSMSRRAQNAYRGLEAIAGVEEIPQVVEALVVGAGLPLASGNADALTAAAQRIRELGQGFSDSADGAGLEALDPLVAGQRVPRVPSPADPAASGEPAEAPPAATPTGEPAAGQPAAQPAVASAPELPGQIRSRPAWHDTSTQYSMVGAGECGSCHGGAEEWWYADPHAEAGFRLLGEDPAARRIADLYGIGAAGMAQGGQICMSCHGTVEPTNQALVSEGVSCESCHGAGSGFLEPHEDGGNPQLGMRDLKDASARAQNCARCHIVSDERLLAAGHPSGADYDIAVANTQIEHWPGRRPDRGRQERGEGAYAALSADALRSAFVSIASSRPIPDVDVVSPPPAAATAPTAPTPTGGPGVGATGAATAPIAGARTPGAGVSSPPSTPAAFPVPEGGTPASLELEPLPESTDELTAEELLLLVKQRLERVYETLGSGN